MEELERRRDEGEAWYGEIERENRERQRKERWERIKDSRYKEIKVEGIPEYMKKGWEESESRWKRIARYRLGNEMRER